MRLLLQRLLTCTRSISYDFPARCCRDLGSQNLIGIKNPVVDKLVAQLIAAPDWETLKARARALDRVLLWNQYVVPNWYLGRFRMVYWNKFGRPDVMPLYAPGFPEAWWAKAAEKQPAARTVTPANAGPQSNRLQP